MKDHEYTGQDLSPVLGALIPASADGARPSATSLGLAEVMIEAARGSDEIAETMDGVLRSLAREAARQAQTGFAGLDPGPRAEVLAKVAAEIPECFERFVALVVSAYYSHPAVVAALGLRPGPPHPRGYDVAPFDESLLEHVRGRPGLYRKI